MLARSTLTEQREVLPIYFRAKKAIPRSVIEGLHNKVKVTFRKSYDFHPDKAQEIARFHALNKLTEPELTHGLFLFNPD
jgi:transposase